MAQAKTGNIVKVHYTGKLEDGTIFDSSSGRDPLEFQIGEGQIISGFEQAVMGMEPGESKTVVVTSDEAYGPHYEERVFILDRSKFPAEVEIGQQYQVNQEAGQSFVVTVTDVNPGSVTLDGNHPLAGEDLTFDIELLEVV
ncbi:MAG TPA: peptidylprolyl isomerase [Anaerolineae bacterium]|nr:peptidylprolyl isomerase [Anaerolineae bacterium]HMR65554.1 peptidylprolyl isomerase [Anaerolineae bacterium]